MNEVMKHFIGGGRIRRITDRDYEWLSLHENSVTTDTGIRKGSTFEENN